MPTTAADLTGGCLCGAVRYRLAGTPFDAGWCHCRTCQINSGSPAMAFAKVLSDDFVIESGGERIRRYASSAVAERWFCDHCGTPLLVRDFAGTTPRLQPGHTRQAGGGDTRVPRVLRQPDRLGRCGRRLAALSAGTPRMTPAALHESMHALLREVTASAILPRYRKLAAHEVTAKGIGDVVTVADGEAEEMLAAGLARIADLPVVGEEAAHADPSIQGRLAADCWIVDPLDGTRNFAAGKPPFGILIAMAAGGEAHTGWIYDCLTDRFCVAHRGKGAFVNGEKVTARPTGETPPVAAVSLIFMDNAPPRGPSRQQSPTTARSTCPTAPPSSTRASRWA
jgi:hypothetical protein